MNDGWGRALLLKWRMPKLTNSYMIRNLHSQVVNWQERFRTTGYADFLIVCYAVKADGDLT